MQGYPRQKEQERGGGFLEKCECTVDHIMEPVEAGTRYGRRLLRWWYSGYRSTERAGPSWYRDGPMRAIVYGVTKKGKTGSREPIPFFP